MVFACDDVSSVGVDASSADTAPDAKPISGRWTALVDDNGSYSLSTTARQRGTWELVVVAGCNVQVNIAYDSGSYNFLHFDFTDSPTKAWLNYMSGRSSFVRIDSLAAPPRDLCTAPDGPPQSYCSPTELATLLTGTWSQCEGVTPFGMGTAGVQFERASG